MRSLIHFLSLIIKNLFFFYPAVKTPAAETASSDANQPTSQT